MWRIKNRVKKGVLHCYMGILRMWALLNIYPVHWKRTHEWSVLHLMDYLAFPLASLLLDDKDSHTRF